MSNTPNLKQQYLHAPAAEIEDADVDATEEHTSRLVVIPLPVFYKVPLAPVAPVAKAIVAPLNPVGRVTKRQYRKVANRHQVAKVLRQQRRAHKAMLKEAHVENGVRNMLHLVVPNVKREWDATS